MEIRRELAPGGFTWAESIQHASISRFKKWEKKLKNPQNTNAAYTDNTLND
jgi:hypothetical protein